MRQFIRPCVTALSIACLAASLAFMQAAPAAAQQAGAGGASMQIKQMALTQKQLDGVVASEKEMDPITSKLDPNAKPDSKVMAQLDGIAKKNGFASFDEFSTVLDNISLVFAGIDPATKKYVGSEAVIKQQITQIQADKKMTAPEKKEALDELNQALKQPAPAVENKGNIDLVVANYDKLAPMMSEDTQ